MNRATKAMFEVGAAFYGWMTWQPIWREHCASLVDHFGDVGASPRVLDLGIGPGISGIAVKDRLPQSHVVGVDFSERMLQKARRYSAEAGVELELLCADAAKLPLDDDSFDVVMGHSFLYLLPDPEAVVDEIERVLRPGGRCVFLEPHEEGRHSDWMKMIGSDGRFVLSMALWRIVSGQYGRFSVERLRALLSRRLDGVEVHSSLGRLALVATAHKAGEGDRD